MSATHDSDDQVHGCRTAVLLYCCPVVLLYCPQVVLDHMKVCWKFLCTCYGCQYALSRVGRS
jgi:hypothetical protein